MSISKEKSDLMNHIVDSLLYNSCCFGLFIFWGYPLMIFTNPSDRAGYDTRSIFKRSLTGLNSEFSLS